MAPSLEHYAVIDAQLEAGNYAPARAALADYPRTDKQAAVLRVKLGLYDETLPAGAAMSRLIQLMREDPDIPGAKQLYQVASGWAYKQRQSSVSHSHPPPPMTNSR